MRGQRGQSIAEAAVATAIFLVVCLAVFDFGRAMWAWQALTEAARTATRYATVRGAGSPLSCAGGARANQACATNADCPGSACSKNPRLGPPDDPSEAVASSRLKSVILAVHGGTFGDAAALDVDATWTDPADDTRRTNNDPGQVVTVTVRYPFAPVTLAGAYSGARFTLSATSKMRVLR